jgi:surface antigen
MNLKKLITTCSLAAVLSGATMPAYADDLLGTLIGGAAGAAIGSNVGKGKGRIAAIAVGTLVGAGIGNSLSNSAPAPVYATSYNGGYYNRTYYNNGYRYHHPHSYTTYTTYRAPAPSYWVAPAPQVVEVNSYQPATAQEYCREFSQGVTIGGQMQPSYGIACLQPDGSWKIKN